MGKQKACHMPCSTEGKAHTIPVKERLYPFKPVTIEVARAKIEALGLAIPVEPWQHPYLGVCYATDTHVLTHAPATLPTTSQCHVAVCKASYRRHTTSAPMHTPKAVKARADKLTEQRMAEKEAEAAGDEVDSHSLCTVCFRSLSVVFAHIFVVSLLGFTGTYSPNSFMPVMFAGGIG
jgi:hypothetical protein